MNIRKVIRENGWTLERLASEMVSSKSGEKGISLPALSQILNGNPTLDKLKQIAAIMGITVEDLVREEDSPNVARCPHCGKIIHLS